MDSNLGNVLKFLFPAVVYIYLQSASASPAFGPFTVRVKELAHCENVETEDLIRFDGRSTKINKTSYVFTGNITYKTPFDDDVSIHMDVAKYGNGGWKSNYLTLDFSNACYSLHTYIPKLFEQYLRSIGNKSCPIQPGVYEVGDFPFSYFTVDKFTAPAFQYGNYRGDFTFIKDGKNIGCHSLITDVIPIKRKG